MNNDKQYNIMVVEDEPLLLQAIAMKLAISNFNTDLCATGAEALQILKQGDHIPDVIWLDYYLKDMDGIDLMKEVRKNPLWSQIPVIVVSNSASATKVNNMMAFGNIKYLLKADYDLEDIIKIMTTFIEAQKKEVS